jgi:hypothetical protein
MTTKDETLTDFATEVATDFARALAWLAAHPLVWALVVLAVALD